MTSLLLSVLLSTSQAGVAQPPIPLDSPRPLPPQELFPQPLPGPRVLPPGPDLGPFPVPIPPPAQPVFDSIPSHQEFAARFIPLPGSYKVLILHPRTCKPVEVCFDLPDCGCPKVKVNRRMIEYDYGDIEVEIRFRLFGKVTVDYDD